MLNITDIGCLKKNISSLSQQQRRISDDFMHRISSSDIDELKILAICFYL